MKQIVNKSLISYRDFSKKKPVKTLVEDLDCYTRKLLLYLHLIPHNSINDRKVSCYFLSEKGDDIVEISFYYSHMGVIHVTSSSIDVYFYYKLDQSEEAYSSILYERDLDLDIETRFSFSLKEDGDRFFSALAFKEFIKTEEGDGH